MLRETGGHHEYILPPEDRRRGVRPFFEAFALSDKSETRCCQKITSSATVHLRCPAEAIRKRARLHASLVAHLQLPEQPLKLQRYALARILGRLRGVRRACPSTRPVSAYSVRFGGDVRFIVLPTVKRCSELRVVG